MRRLICLLCFVLAYPIISQGTSDSLYQVWVSSEVPDSVRFIAMHDFIRNEYLFSNPDTAILLTEQLLEQTEKANNNEWSAEALHVLGIAHYYLGHFNKSLNAYEGSIKLKDSYGDERGMASSLNNIGAIFYQQGMLQQALEYYEQGLALRIALNDSDGIAGSLNNIGLIYDDQGKTPQALDYYERSLKIRESIGDRKGEASSLNNIGTVYKAQEKFDKALVYINKSLEIKRDINDKNGMATSLNNIGVIQKRRGDYTGAKENYEKCLKLVSDIGDRDGMALAHGNLGYIAIELNNISEAYQHAEMGLKYAKEIGSPERIEHLAGLYKELYRMDGKGIKALEMHELEVSMRDSIRSDALSQQLAKAESRAAFEKELLLEKQAKEEAERLRKEQLARRNSIQYSGIGIGLLALFGMVFFIGRIRPPRWAIELSVFLPFLILFEFLLVLTDPWIEQITSGAPLFILLVNAAIAALIFPAHSFFEELLKRRILERKSQ